MSGAAHAAPLFPAFLKLDGRRCVVIGGDAAAEPKIDSLLSSGAFSVFFWLGFRHRGEIGRRISPV